MDRPIKIIVIFTDGGKLTWKETDKRKLTIHKVDDICLSLKFTGDGLPTRIFSHPWHTVKHIEQEMA
jgi:hypothetical protein